jgi:hypothetical protein
MAGQVAYHLMAQAGMARAPWPITTIVSCLPVLVLGMGTALAHMLRADAKVTEAPDSGTGPPATPRSLSCSLEDQDGPDRRRPEAAAGTGHRGGTRTLLRRDRNTDKGQGTLPAGCPATSWVRPGLSPGGLPQRGSQSHDERCAAAGSGDPPRP